MLLSRQLDLGRCVKNMLFSNKIYYYKKINFRMIVPVVWILSSFLLAGIQLWLGADMLIITLAWLTLLCCGIPLILFSVNDLPAIFIFILLSKYSFFPFWIKTLMGERIDVGLSAPLITFVIALIGSVIGCLVLIAVKIVPIKKKLLGFSLHSRQLIPLSYISTLWGLLFLTLHVIFSPVILPTGETIQGFGGFGSLLGPLYLGIAGLTLLSAKHKGKIFHRTILIVVFIWIILLSFQNNVKIYFTLSVLSLVLTIFYFKINVKMIHVGYMALFLVFYVLIFAPAIHLTRTSAFKSADIGGKIQILQNLFLNYSLSELSDENNRLFRFKYYSPAGTFVVDRFEMIQDLDIVSFGISDANTIGWIPIDWALKNTLPKFLSPNKPSISDIDLIAYNARYIPVLRSYNHTLGLFGSAYAMFLWPSLISISFVIIFLYLIMLRSIVPDNISYNLFGVFFIARLAFNFSEQSVQALVTTMLRVVPIDTILTLAFLFIVQLISAKSRNNRAEV